MALLAAGLAMRVWFMLVWSPGLTGYSDTGIYFQDAVESLWSDPIRTQGYSMFLTVMHWVAPRVIAAIIVQHVIGLAVAALAYFVVRRCGGSRWLGLAPAAVLAVGGDALFMEHAALSDSLFVALLIATMYCSLRAGEGHARWALAAGAAVGFGVWVRGAGLVMAGVIPLWLLFNAGRPTRRTLALALLSLLAASGVVGSYVVWRKVDSNKPGLLDANNAWNLYGRVGPWADCSKFEPPLGTAGLCEATAPSQRGYRNGGEDYIYNPSSPAQQLFGPPYEESSYPHAMELLQKWSEAAILGEPGAYLKAVWLDTLRLFDSNHYSYSDMSADELMSWWIHGPPTEHGKNEFVEYWQGRLYPGEGPPHHGDIGPLQSWEEATRIESVGMGLLLALLLAGPWLLGGWVRERAPRARAGMILLGLTALAMLFFPILVKGYDYRFVIPSYGPLVGAGALSAWGLWLRLQRRIAGHGPPAGGSSAGGTPAQGA
ncbi:MAG: glycosyltransferase family 39 protein [Acidobacteriota bacterium]|nr:glycosyltransferase family 39 protein [Acidobacteriota bacterium]